MMEPTNEIVVHEPVEVQCGAKAAYCVCSLPPHGTSTPHYCAMPNCGGQWKGDYNDGSFLVVRLPGEVVIP